MTQIINLIDSSQKTPSSCACLSCLTLIAFYRRLLNLKPICVHPKSCLIISSTADETGLVLDLRLSRTDLTAI